MTIGKEESDWSRTDDSDKTKEQLLGELTELRQRIAELRKKEKSYKKTGEYLHDREAQALRESEERYRVMYESSRDAIMTLASPDWSFTSANPATIALFGVKDQDEFIHTSPWKVSPEFQPDGENSAIKAKKMIDTAMEKGSHFFEWTHKKISGETFPVTVLLTRVNVAGQIFLQATVRDITGGKQAEEEREITVEFLRLINESRSRGEMIRAAATFFQKHSGCEAVGIRLKEGDDYPYYEARGFPDEFVVLESSLCSRDASGQMLRDADGNPVLECMCGNIISGRFDPSKPFFTGHGSFWSNCTTDLLATTTDKDRQTRTRNRCNREGYESVALIPLRSGEGRLGLLQLNDRQKNRFTPEMIAFWERLAGYLAVAVAKFQAEESLSQSEALYHSLFDNMLNGFAYCRMLFEQGEPRDFIYLSVNHAFETLTGLKDVVGKRVTEVIPGIREADPELFETYGRVALTGKPERFEMFVEALQMWFWVSVYSPKREYFVAIFDVITERKKVEAERERLVSAIEQSADTIVITDKEGTIQYVNPAFEAVAGYARNEAIGQTPRILKSGRQDKAFYNNLWATITSGKTWEGRLINKKKDGSLYTEDASITPVRDATGAIVSYVAVKRDVTEHLRIHEEKEKLEAQLLQSQKMEAVGQLAGGIAHDFNNILSAIIGYGSLMQMRMQDDDPNKLNLNQVLAASERAANLTQSLLAFGRKQVLNPKDVDLNDIIRTMEKFLSRVIGEDIEFKVSLATDALIVFADTTQIEQVLMNLVTNARDAMPNGGRLIVETKQAGIDNDYIRLHGYGERGQCAVLSVTDTGIGMDKHMREKIFEPFFTTKELGRGTGLGLSTVYGIVKQHRGFIDVDSEIGKGTTFMVYLPLVKTAANAAESRRMPERPRGGTETILIAEDDGVVRALIKEVLRQAGYTVIEATDGEEAVKRFVENRDSIQLFLTDVIMPIKNGREIYAEIQKVRSDVKALFTSGYPADFIQKEGVLEKGLNFIPKPVAPMDLLKKVREILDS